MSRLIAKIYCLGGYFDSGEGDRQIDQVGENEFEMGVRKNPLAPQIAVPLTPAQQIESRPPSEVRKEIAKRVVAITALDFRGLTPADVASAMTQQANIDSLTERYESELGTNTRAASLLNYNRLKDAQAKASDRVKVMFQAKVKAAEDIAQSNLTYEEKIKRLERLREDNDLVSVLDQAVSAAGLPKSQEFGNDREAVARQLFQKPYAELNSDQQAKVNTELRRQPTNYGADREAVSQELFNKPYSALDSTQRTRVNELIVERTGPGLEIIRTDEGAFIINKRTGETRQLNPDGSPGQTFKPVDPDRATIEGGNVGEVPRQRTLPVPSQTTPRTQPSTPTTPSGRAQRNADALVNGLRDMGLERAVELYRDAISSSAPESAKRAYREAILKAYPELQGQLPVVGVTGETTRGVEPVAPQQTTPSEVPAAPEEYESMKEALRKLGKDRAVAYALQVINSNTSASRKELYRRAIRDVFPEAADDIPANSPTQSLNVSPREGVLASLLSPREAAAATTQGNIQPMPISASAPPANEAVAIIRNLGREKALRYYLTVMEDTVQKRTPEQKEQIRAAIVQAFPGLADVLTVPKDATPQKRPFGATAPPKPTDAENRALNFGVRAMSANSRIGALEELDEFGTGSVLSRLESLAQSDPARARALGATVGGVGGGVVGVVVGGLLGGGTGLVLGPWGMIPMFTLNAMAGRMIGGPAGAALGTQLGGFAADTTVSIAEGLANKIRNPDEQRYFQAKMDFIAAVLRKESGAVINKDEFAREELRYFPRLDDSPQVIRQKARARELAIQGLNEESGRRLQ